MGKEFLTSRFGEQFKNKYCKNKNFEKCKILIRKVKKFQDFKNNGRLKKTCVLQVWGVFGQLATLFLGYFGC